MTKIAIDCEFNGFGGQLISMALVTEWGDEWYEVLDLPEKVDDWVGEHVVPVLFREPVNKDHFRLSLRMFLERVRNPVIMADWYTDLMYFFQCFQGEDHSQSMHIPLKAELLENMDYAPSAIPHNALADARAIMESVRSRSRAA
jgi:hypothetical protein